MPSTWNTSMRFYPSAQALSIVITLGLVSLPGVERRAVAADQPAANGATSQDPAEKPTESPATARRRTVAEEIDRCLDNAREIADHSTRFAELRAAATALTAKLEFNAVARGELEEAAKRSAAAADDSTERAAKILRDGLRSVRDLLRFEPTMEAPLPEGFPEPMPVGEIGIKVYPAYRMARAVDGDEGRAFNQLFAHIQRNNIEMTAPVEMTMDKNEAGEMRSLDMAFLYQSRELGKPGVDRSVKVQDISPLTTVSLGMRGSTDRKRIADAEKRLSAWLTAHANEYVAAGSVRVMGYNSPFVPESLRYFEVEIPIKPAVGRPGN